LGKITGLLCVQAIFLPATSRANWPFRTLCVSGEPRTAELQTEPRFNESSFAVGCSKIGVMKSEFVAGFKAESSTRGRELLERVQSRSSPISQTQKYSSSKIEHQSDNQKMQIRHSGCIQCNSRALPKVFDWASTVHAPISVAVLA